MTAFFVNALKPPGMTSHDVVSFARRRLGLVKVGHAGTLDPQAAGVLPLGVGRATRLLAFVGEAPKAYLCEVTFGMETSTLDSEGVPVRTGDASRLDFETVQEALGTFVGEIEQEVPAMSAVKVGGRRLYDLARSGREVKLPARKVTIHSVRLVRFWSLGGVRAMIEVSCGKGTYIRALCRDLGRLLGCGAFASFLLRTRVGAFGLRDAFTLEELEESARETFWQVPPHDGLITLPEVKVSDPAAVRLLRGVAPSPRDILAWPGARRGQPVRISSPEGDLLAVGRIEDDEARTLKLEVVLASEGDQNR